MSILYLDIIGFIIVTGIIILTGSRLSRYGNMMADKLAVEATKSLNKL